MAYDSKMEWTRAILCKTRMRFPAEYVIRIFMGEYPRLNLRRNDYQGKKICDVGCGRGRHMIFLEGCGFDVYGMEITDEIVNKIRSNLKQADVDGEVRTGTNDNIPFEDAFFDYLLSWNAGYYMGQQGDFDKYVEEFARVLKPEGYFIFSMPKKTCFIYKNSEKLKDGYQIIRNDVFNLRNGEVFRMFKDEKDMEKNFSRYFKNFVFGSVNDDCFGYNYHWHLMICRRK